MTLKQRARRSGFHLLRLGARLAALGGMAGLHRWGERFGRWHYRFGGRKRRSLIEQLQPLLADRIESPGDINGLLLQAYQVNDRAILEIVAAYSGAVGVEQFAASVALEGRDQLDQARADGRGVVLLGMHSGNGVALAAHLARLGYPVNVVYRESNKISPSFFRDGIPRLGLKAISTVPAASGVRRMLSALKSGEILFILMDQGSKRHGQSVRFLGKEMKLPAGPIELARRSGAAIVPAWLAAVDRQWHFRLDSPIHLDAARELEHEVKMVSDLMQQAILANPQWWSWHQRRWWRYPFISEVA